MSDFRKLLVWFSYLIIILGTGVAFSLFDVLSVHFCPQWTSNLQCQPQLGPLRSPSSKMAGEDKALNSCTSKSPAPPILLRGCPTPSKLHPSMPHSLTTPSMKMAESSMGSDPTTEQLVPERDTNPGTGLTVDMCSSSAVQESLGKGMILAEENKSCNPKVQHR